MIKGAGVTIDNDAYGIRIRSAADSIYRQVSRKYGPTEKSDLSSPGSIWDEARHWTMGLRTGERTYAYLWRSEDGFAPVGHVRELGIIAKALSSDSGYIVLEYLLTTAQSCDAKIEQTEAGVF